MMEGTGIVIRLSFLIFALLGISGKYPGFALTTSTEERKELARREGNFQPGSGKMLRSHRLFPSRSFITPSLYT